MMLHHPIAFKLDKKELMDFALGQCNPKARSFADLGGCWGVNGAYTFYGLESLNADRAFLVDTDVPESVQLRAREFECLTIINGNFGEDAVATAIGFVDAILLFDVLLHQVNPNWNGILKKYACRTNWFLIYNQQWIKSNHTVRLLDLGRNEYFKNVPHKEEERNYKALFKHMYEQHPIQRRVWRDIHNVWQWGISDCDLLRTMEELGFDLQYFKNCGRFGSLENFENHAFAFHNMNER